MRDISEIPGGTEQAKPTGAKPRSTARSKPENTTTGGQEQETKVAPRRRTAASSQTPTSAPAGGEAGATSTTRPAPRTPRVQQGGEGVQAPPPQREQSAPTSAQSGPRSEPTAGSSPAAQPAPARPTPNRPAAPQQNTFNQSAGGPAAQRPNGAPRPNNGGTGQRGSGPGYAPRPAPTSAQRSNGPAGAPPNGGARPAPTYRNNPAGPAPQQRQGGNTSYQQRGPGGAGTANHLPPSAPSQRSGQRPGSTGPGRPGGQTHHTGTGNARPTSRPGNAPRPQERRVAAVKEKPTGPISLPPQIIVKDLADLLSVSPIEVIRDLINKHSIFANINEVVDYEKAALVAKDLGFEPSPTETGGNAAQGERALSANEAMIAARDTDQDTVVIPPVVTIMGHVDHGKTSLLDTIRKTKVAAGEAGGITQHIGAYQVEVNGKKITFLDTPGHEAFTAMRARGAQVTHIAIIVVAADDGVMPQTREAIDHAKAAKVPIIIALNKIDKANANPDRVKQQLAEIGVVIEEYGGDTVCVPVSARRGEGIDELLDYILLVAEVQDIRANPNRPATGVIIEARLEKNSGATATVLVQQGTLKMGDNIVVGTISGKVRAMFNDRGKRIQKAPPSTPVSILGLAEVPQASDHLEVVPDEKTAKQHAQEEAEKRKNEAMPLGQVSLDTLYMQMQEGKVKELDVILKCDVQGSAEAIKGSLSKLGEENRKVRLIHEGIGNISETDVHLAGASGAIIIGFNVKADGAAQREAQREGVDIRYYNVIYKLIDDIQAALVGMLEPTYREVIDGHAEVLQTFKVGKNLVIAGSRVTDGKIARSSQVRLLRKGTKVFEGKVASLRRGKDDVREVSSGYECGIVLEDFNEIETEDIIEAYSQERVKPGA